MIKPLLDKLLKCLFSGEKIKVSHRKCRMINQQIHFYYLLIKGCCLIVVTEKTKELSSVRIAGLSHQLEADLK